MVSLNMKRRNLSRDQTAVAAAEAWEMYASPRGRPDKPREGRGLAKRAIASQARALVERDPQRADMVNSGGHRAVS